MLMRILLHCVSSTWNPQIDNNEGLSKYVQQIVMLRFAQMLVDKEKYYTGSTYISMSASDALKMVPYKVDYYFFLQKQRTEKYGNAVMTIFCRKCNAYQFDQMFVNVITSSKLWEM